MPLSLSIINWYRRWRSTAGRVTVGLASHWPYVTDWVVYPPTRSKAPVWDLRIRLRFFESEASFTFTLLESSMVFLPCTLGAVAQIGLYAQSEKFSDTLRISQRLHGIKDDVKVSEATWTSTMRENPAGNLKTLHRSIDGKGSLPPHQEPNPAVETAIRASSFGPLGTLQWTP